MTATQPRVRVSVDAWATGPAVWSAWCPWCCRHVAEHRYTFAMAMEDALDHYCAGVRLAALLASLEALRDQWRVAGDGNNSEGRAFRYCADDLHRVIEGARG